MNWQSKLLTSLLFVIAAALTAYVESIRPRPVRNVSVDKLVVRTATVTELCEPELLKSIKTHDESLAKKWRFLEAGPGRDLCFNFVGRVANPSNDAPSTQGDIDVDVCFTFQPGKEGTTEVMGTEAVVTSWGTLHDPRKDPRKVKR